MERAFDAQRARAPQGQGVAQRVHPKDFHYTLLDSDFDHFEDLMTNALGRVPLLETAGVKELINGPESFTPDGNFILGESPEQNNFYVGAGFNAYGIAAGPFYKICSSRKPS